MDNLSLFGSSPATVTATTLLQYKEKDKDRSQNRLGLNDFIREIPKTLSLRKGTSIAAGSKKDPIMELFDRLDLTAEEWKPYAWQDSSMHYTRNLIATDNTSYTLLLLCWNAGHHSPIHDHPCDGCWMKVLHGQVQECRYRRGESDSHKLVCTQDITAKQDDIVYIDDSQGYHKVGNPHPTEIAYTLHLYSPPFQSCKIWLDETKTSTCTFQNYSAYGKKL